MVIASYITGRLGNQMFQYAFVRTIQSIYGGKLVINFQRVLNKRYDDNGFEDALQYFQVTKYDTTGKNIVLAYGNFIQKLLYLLYGLDKVLKYRLYNREQWYEKFRNKGLLFSNHKENEFCQYETVLKGLFNSRCNFLCQGKFENPEFFNSIRPQLLEEFTPKLKPRNENGSLYSIIQSNNSVCVSIRRGDFLSDKFREDFYVCDEGYFHRAIEEVKKRIENPVLLFFSDDIDWVKDNIRTDLPSYYESGKDPVWEKLRLMYSCKHFVISNSTFSWWAQYLSRYEQKIVIAPEKWSNNVEKNNACKLLLDNFVKIPCG